jgi:hypothetical protein
MLKRDSQFKMQVEEKDKLMNMLSKDKGKKEDHCALCEIRDLMIENNKLLQRLISTRQVIHTTDIGHSYVEPIQTKVKKQKKDEDVGFIPSIDISGMSISKTKDEVETKSIDIPTNPFKNK